MTSLLAHARRQFTWPYPSEMVDSYGFLNPYSAPYSTSSYGPATEAPPVGFIQLVQGPFRGNPVVFACELKRISIFSEARFIWRRFTKGHPGGMYTTPDLDILEHPWPRGTTADLLANMLLYADIGGNAFVHRDGNRLRVLRPDWVTIVMGDSSGRPVKTPSQLDAEIIGFIYDPKDGQTEPEPLLVDEVCHFAPIPDPLARFRGMSWLTPVIREVQADQAAMMHKLRFFEQGATPQVVVSLDASTSPEAFDKFQKKMDEAHAGWRNAYKTLYVAGAQDVSVVGKDLQQLDFSSTQGHGETRIIMASGMNAIILSSSEGMQGSSLNAGNYAAARDNVADTCLHPLWAKACGALAQIVPPPDSGSELWYLEDAIPFLRQDIKKQAETVQIRAQSMYNLSIAGYTRDSIIAAVTTDDLSQLQPDEEWVSVHLQPSANAGMPVPRPAPSPGSNPPQPASGPVQEQPQPQGASNGSAG